jgi:hypothetical protein
VWSGFENVEQLQRVWGSRCGPLRIRGGGNVPGSQPLYQDSKIAISEIAVLRTAVKPEILVQSVALFQPSLKIKLNTLIVDGLGVNLVTAEHDAVGERVALRVLELHRRVHLRISD